jgi:phospholipid/cholesterol/gamma-HCH transport system permease protein
MDNLVYRQEKDTLVIEPHGNLNTHMVEDFWMQTDKKIKTLDPQRIVIDGSETATCDGAGIAFLLAIKEKQDLINRSFRLTGFRDDLLELIESNNLRCDITTPAKITLGRKIFEETGHFTWLIVKDIQSQISFFGELAYNSVVQLTHPGRIRFSDLWLFAEKAGANGVCIVSLLGFLIGLILAFQSAIALQMFGAEVYVADMVVLVMFRELGPLITAFIVASRSGSAYAAELGTMKVNEELDALKTFGLEPMSFLIVPRVFALVITLPLLTMFSNLFSLLGAELVMIGLKYSPSIFWEHVTNAAGLNDLFGGIFKTIFFGFLIGAIGCLKGMQTGKGASAVGDSATKAVVACIVMLVLVDFMFAITYYVLGI